MSHIPLFYTVFFSFSHRASRAVHGGGADASRGAPSGILQGGEVPWNPSSIPPTPCINVHVRIHTYVCACMCICVYVCVCVCMHVHTCYVLINPPMPIHYVLAAVFASCFLRPKNFTSRMRIYFLLRPSRCVRFVFYVLFKFRFVREGTKRYTYVYYIRIIHTYIRITCTHIHIDTHVSTNMCVCVCVFIYVYMYG